MNKCAVQVTKPHRTSISCKLIHMSVIDSSLEGWQTSKINDERWQTIPDNSDSFSEKNDVWHSCDLHLMKPCMEGATSFHSVKKFDVWTSTSLTTINVSMAHQTLVSLPITKGLQRERNSCFPFFFPRNASEIKMGRNGTGGCFTEEEMEVRNAFLQTSVPICPSF